MPNYLTPGVYVEEIPAQSKPIEGVGTSIAAFVGLAPGGPVNTPMRISNWTQFAKLYGDPSNPDNGPFMDGRVPRPLRLRLLPERRRRLLDRARRRRRRRGRPAPQAALPAATDAGVEAFRAIALPGVDRRRVESSCAEETPRQARRGRGRRQDAADEPTYKLIVPPGEQQRGDRGPHAQEGPQHIADQGQRAARS